MSKEVSSGEYQKNKRPLFLTKEPLLIHYQLRGGEITELFEDELLDAISTDEIIPNSACLSYTGHEDGYLGEYLLTGLRGNSVLPGEVKAGNFSVLVAGSSYGRGSSRMHAPVAHHEAGIDLIVANTERIFQENCIATGILTLSHTNPSVQGLLEGKEISREDAISELSPVSQEIVRNGGLLPFLKAFREGKIQAHYPETEKRPMTMVEKIVAQKVIHSNGSKGIDYVAPGNAYIVEPDSYYGYELQTTITRALLQKEFGNDISVRNPSKLSLFDDHTALMPETYTPVAIQRNEQKAFALPLLNQGTVLYEKRPEGGVEGICHTIMLEHVLPGQITLGNDSHTCTVGANNALAVGKGAADLAGAIAFDKMVLEVPETIRYDLVGKLQPGVTTNDLMLYLLSTKELKHDLIGSGRVFEFGGSALNDIPYDDQVVLANMAIEGQAFTGIIEPNEKLIIALMKEHNKSRAEIESMLVYSDPDAEYSHKFVIDLSKIEYTIAEPGDTQNGISLSQAKEKFGKEKGKFTTAYIGSCTHGKIEDLKAVAEVLKEKHVAEGIKLYVQTSSLKHLQEAEKLGYIEIIKRAGAEILLPGCGACMNAGPGATTSEDEVGLYATNRNFTGRTGKGRTWLASPAVVAASAVKGELCSPDDLE